MLTRIRTLAAVAMLATACSVALAQQALDNAAVLKLHAAGLADDLIVQTVASSPGHYDTGVDAMIALKQAGIGDKVIGAMVQRTPTLTARCPWPRAALCFLPA